MKLPFALVGCGKIAAKHLRALEALGEEIRVVAVVDPDRRARQGVQEVLGVRGYESLEELVKKEKELKLVGLASPTGLHPAQAIRCAEAGVDVLMEKPLGTSFAAAEEMVRRFDELGRRLFVVKQLRFHPLFLALREAIRGGRFGRVHTVAMQLFWSRGQDYYDSAPWRGTREMDGGALMNQASHYVDLLDWLFGPVKRVHALGGALGRRIEVEDTAVVTLEWEEGFLGSLHVTMLTYPQNLATSLTVIGSEGTVRLDGKACDQVVAWEFARSVPEDEEMADLAARVGPTLARGHERVYREVLASLEGAAAEVVDGGAGLRSLAIIDAAYQALESGECRAVRSLSLTP